MLNDYWKHVKAKISCSSFATVTVTSDGFKRVILVRRASWNKARSWRSEALFTNHLGKEQLQACLSSLCA